MEYIIAHSGIKGMKWGVRRYQNEDGTLTDAGKKKLDTYKTKNIKRATSQYVKIANKYSKKSDALSSKAKNEKNSNKIAKLNEKSDKNHRIANDVTARGKREIDKVRSYSYADMVKEKRAVADKWLSTMADDTGASWVYTRHRTPNGESRPRVFSTRLSDIVKQDYRLSGG